MTLAGFSLFDTAVFNRALFFPSPRTTPAPPGAEDHFVDVGAQRTPARVHLRLYAGATDRTQPRALLFHGNGEVVADYDELASAFADVGVDLAVADYRGYGASTGTPSLPDAIEDALEVFDALRAHEPGRPLVVVGRSLGSAAAHHVAAHRGAEVSALVIDSGFSDLRALVRRRGFPVPDVLVDARFDARAKLARGGPPVLFVHGANDTVIHVAEAVDAHAAATAQKHLVVLPGRGHNDLFADTGYWQALREFFETTLGPRAPG